MQVRLPTAISLDSHAIDVARLGVHRHADPLEVARQPPGGRPECGRSSSAIDDVDELVRSVWEDEWQ